LRTLTLAGLARRQLAARWISFLPTAIGLGAALALAAAVTFTQSRTEEAGLQQTVSGLGAQGLVSVHLTGVINQTQYDQLTTDVMQAARGDMGGLIALREVGLISGGYVQQTVNGQQQTGFGDFRIAAYENLSAHAVLVSGTWPSGPPSETLEATLPAQFAGLVHLGVGDVACAKVQDGTDIVCVRIVGIWRPAQPQEAFWGQTQQPEVAAYVDVPTYFAMLGKQTDTVTGGLHTSVISAASAILSPDLDVIHAVGANATLDRIQLLRGHFGIQRADVVVVSSLPDALATYIDAEQVAAFAVLLVAIQLLLIALYCVWFMAGNLLGHLRPTIAVWRTRGWSWPGVALLLWIELVVVALLAAPIGIIAGWVASEAVARWAYAGVSTPAFHFDPVKLVPPVVGVFAIELALIAGQAVLASRNGVLQTRAGASRPGVSWWRQRHIDLVLAILAIPMLAETRLLGGAQVRLSGAADNPLDLLLPGVGVALIAVAALRLLPPAARLVLRIRRTVSVQLAATQLIRAPGQHSALAVLFILATALGVFATTYATTSARNSADRAAYQVGADVRGVLQPGVGVPPYSIHVSGAAARSDVFRGYSRQASEDVPALAVDPYTFTSVMWTRPDLAASPLTDLVQRLADQETGGLLLPSHARSLSIWVYGAATGGRLTADLSDAHGRPVHADFGTLDFAGWKQLSATLVAEAGAQTDPLRFRDLAISTVAKPDLISLSSLAVDGKVIESFSEQVSGPGAQIFSGLWWRTDAESGTYYETLSPRVEVQRDGSPTASFRIGTGTYPTYFRPGVLGFRPGFAARGFSIPALVPSQMLNQFGLAVGKQLQVEIDGVGVTATIVGVADHFPTLYPEIGDFIVLDRDPLLIALAYGRHQSPWANEIWVKAAPGGADAAVASLRAAAGVIQVLDQRAIAADAAHAPQQLGLEANLLLGFAAAIGLALLAFGFHFLMLARGRLSEYAVLEANGMSPPQVRRSLVWEEVILVAFCTACGAALGVVAAIVLLPTLQLGASVPDVVPATIVTFDPLRLLEALVLVGVGALVAGPALAFVAERPRVMAELRALG
jgi:FtsX-like permease family protein